MKTFCQDLKFVLINFLIVFLLFSNNAKSERIFSEYLVISSGIKIGQFTWLLNIEEDKYETEILLKNSGLFSPLYKFKGEYVSEGVIDNNYFETKYYKQYWKTNKKTKVVEMYFEDKLTSLKQQPEENEVARLNLYNLFGYFDPIVSFINILNGKILAKTIDGRRVYNMSKINIGDSEKITLEIQDYKNIWADHKRNDLKKIEFYLDDGFLPVKINVYFKERVFKLKKI